MKLKSEYVEKIENRCYELLLRLRYRLELRKSQFSLPNFDFAIKIFNKGYEVDLLAEPDVELLYLSLIKNLVNLVCLEEGDVNLVLMDIFSSYLQYIDKSDKV